MHVLVIDDELAIRQILTAMVSRAGYSCDTAENVREATAKLVRGDVDVALCDIMMPDGNGVDLVRSIKGSGIETQFIMVTAFASVETAVEALRAGATDYIVKPVRNEELMHRLAQINSLCGLKAENQALRQLMVGDKGVFHFTSPSMVEMDRLVSKVAVTDSTVLITGESGTGKGITARCIHEMSPRGDLPFIPVNCSAIPENLMESEFFGHSKGAFTGADRARKGLFSQADRGTLFLDEIGELPLHMQTKLLHVIEDKEVRPLGGEQARRVDTRIIAATNRNLVEMVKDGSFREDLYFRLSMFQIHIPPLRERKEDISRLIHFLLQSFAGVHSRKLLELDPMAEEVLMGYGWPGNVRELENVINRAHILADGGRITLADLPPDIARQPASSDIPGTNLANGSGLREQLRRVEADIIVRTLRECDGDRKTAAQKLEIGLSSLYRKLEELEIMGSGKFENG
ncbi:sigma-54-dependent transcriptional regulator [Denitratisoma oestradiolicum]|uniref:Regulatory protein AtoC n=1 Tax=Denitratisoma oestradiolicum TaxID=311182 RepID=A0A6S6XXU9_9PROT|nr:sigma-54 dependent transcriptional regulator [Denitratisoma oestradiolicum]TWO80602.1 sigma-54-dependent Fis family transcriptional regulator [Denitratisoma oestradiolicum]CAB1367679.1 Regulatory protein AtoC [Denitratisoma oestradiolicum]